jgi:hypothetical protein
MRGKKEKKFEKRKKIRKTGEPKWYSSKYGITYNEYPGTYEGREREKV